MYCTVPVQRAQSVGGEDTGAGSVPEWALKRRRSSGSEHGTMYREISLRVPRRPSGAALALAAGPPVPLRASFASRLRSRQMSIHVSERSHRPSCDFDATSASAAASPLASKMFAFEATGANS